MLPPVFIHTFAEIIRKIFNKFNSMQLWRCVYYIIVYMTAQLIILMGILLILTFSKKNPQCMICNFTKLCTDRVSSANPAAV